MMAGALALTPDTTPTPCLVAAVGPNAEQRFWEFFAVTIRNRNTRAAYLRAVRDFCAFATARGAVDLRGVTPMHVAAWVESDACRRQVSATARRRGISRTLLMSWRQARDEGRRAAEVAIGVSCADFIFRFSNVGGQSEWLLCKLWRFSPRPRGAQNPCPASVFCANFIFCRQIFCARKIKSAHEK
jgi:hypothetical protein